MQDFKIVPSKPDSSKIWTAKQFYENSPFGLDKVYQLCHREDFPSLKIGRKYYVLRDEVMEWFKNHTDEQI
jgi:hypothetical protein